MRLCTLHPSLLLGPGDDRLSSTTDVLRFLRRDIPFIPSGGLNFVDVRDAADAFVSALDRGDDERYLLGGPNWSFREFFGRLERMTKIPGPRLRAPDSVSVLGARLIDAVYRRLDKAAPVDGESAEMGTYFWYLDDSRARQQLGFRSRDPSETLYETVRYLRHGEAVLG
jgi:dihydroflavonol-4-reductase